MENFSAEHWKTENRVWLFQFSESRGASAANWRRFQCTRRGPTPCSFAWKGHHQPGLVDTHFHLYKRVASADRVTGTGIWRRHLSQHAPGCTLKRAFRGTVECNCFSGFLFWLHEINLDKRKKGLMWKQTWLSKPVITVAWKAPRRWCATCRNQYSSCLQSEK